MAMYEHEGPSKQEIHDAFCKAAADGKRYLLVLTERGDDLLMITDYDYMRAVADVTEIVPLVRDAQNSKPYMTISLSGIFDLSGQYDVQAEIPGAQQIKNLLPPAAQAGLIALDQDIKRGQAQRAWESRPFYERLFVAKPV